jgi:histidyl-tRNA synthetase
MGETESQFAFNCVQELRNNNIACELYHENTKMDKQFKYADKKNIPFAVIIGSKEIQTGEAVIKSLSTGIQETVPVNQLSLFFQNRTQ